MNELKRIEENIRSVFAESSYPKDFLETYDQMECLAAHTGRETFLVRKKATGETAVAKCYDRAVFPFRPHANLLGGIAHPGLPRFIGEYQNEKILCVVREYVEGEPLSEWARERRLSVPQITGLAAQLCDVLSALHGHTPPVIHRDIKPENVIVKPDGSIALIDFDLSRPYREEGGGDTVYFGTRGYAPPEQYGFGQTDARSDIYALGVLLRWLLTGSEKDNPNVSIDPRLQRVIDRCTAFSPKERFRDAGEVRRALRRAERPAFPLRRVLLLSAAILVGLAAGFSAGRFTDWLRPVPEIVFTEPLIERAARLQIGKERGALTREDLSGVRRLYVYGDEAYGDPDLFYRQTVDRHAEGPLRTLDDLSLLPALEEIHIARQGYLDVRGIADLVHLETADLKHMRISGVQPVANVSRLRQAILFDCGLSDVTALEACPWLETLDVGLNPITDLREIGSHPNVRSLGLMWLKLPSLDGIESRFPKLQAVTLQHGSVADLSGLRALPALAAVYALPEQEADVRAALAGTRAEVVVTEN